MRPDDEADEADGAHGVGHAEVAEHRLLRERRDQLADDAERRQDDDVHLRVAEEPEQVLPQQRIAAARHFVEVRSRSCGRSSSMVSAPASTGMRQQQQEGGDQDRPDEQRHPVHRHARRAHVEDGDDEVDRAEDRAGARHVQGEDAEVDRRARMVGDRRQRRIDRPAGSRPLADHRRQRQQHQSRPRSARS